MSFEVAGGAGGAVAPVKLETRVTGTWAQLDRTPRVVIIDGRSGSGKTTLAAQIAHLLDAQTLHLEDLYPGWNGLAAGSRLVPSALRDAQYQRYDWGTGTHREWVRLDRYRPLVIEGCGSLTRPTLAAARRFVAGQVQGGSAARAVWTIWIECPEPFRKSRALARDQGDFAPHWEEWAAQEALHFAATRPLPLAAEIAHTG